MPPAKRPAKMRKAIEWGKSEATEARRKKLLKKIAERKTKKHKQKFEEEE